MEPDASTPTTQQVVDALREAVPARTLTEAILRLPFLRDLPFKGVIVLAAELIFLLGLFFLLRYVFCRIVSRTSERISKYEDNTGQHGRAARVRTLAGLTQSIGTFLLTFVFGISGLSVLGVNVLGLIGTAGIAGLAVGFGAQRLVKDVISGFFILLEDQYAVGDYITIGTVTGTVEDLGMRITRLRDDDGKLYILANGDITMVCNQSRGDVSSGFDLSIAPTADVKKATEVLNAALASLSKDLDLADPAKVVGISALDATKTTLHVTFRAKTGQRPGPLAPRLREAARDALIGNSIPVA